MQQFVAASFTVVNTSFSDKKYLIKNKESVNSQLRKLDIILQFQVSQEELCVLCSYSELANKKEERSGFGGNEIL